MSSLNERKEKKGESWEKKGEKVSGQKQKLRRTMNHMWFTSDFYWNVFRHRVLVVFSSCLVVSVSQIASKTIPLSINHNVADNQEVSRLALMSDELMQCN